LRGTEKYRRPLGVGINVDRQVDQGGIETAKHRAGFCLDQLEKYGLAKGLKLSTEIATRLKIEEIIGALVAAEQVLKSPLSDES
jgi:hypothetical protein